MRRLAPREKVIVAVGAVALVLFLYLFALLLPARRALATSARERAQLTEKLRQAEVMYHEAMSERETMASLRQKTASLMCPWPDVQAGMVGELQTLSKELGITVTSIRPGESESADGSTRNPAEIKVEADLGKIVRLLYELEQPSRRLWVEGVEMAPSRQATSHLLATIHIAAYSPGHQSEAGNAEA